MVLGFNMMNNHIATIMQPLMSESIYYMLKEGYKKETIDVMQDLEGTLFKHILFTIYYNAYRPYLSKHSIRWFETQESDETIERDTSIYDKHLRTYEKFRTLKDEQAKAFLADDFIAKYEKLPTITDKLSGHKLSIVDWNELKNNDESLFLNALAKHKLHDIKKISLENFKTLYFPELKDKDSKIYKNIFDVAINTDIDCFAVCANLYALERNCCIEKFYQIAKAISTVKKKADRVAEKDDFLAIYDTLTELNFSDYFVVGYDTILSIYSFPDITATDIAHIIFICNDIIRRTIFMFFDKIYSEFPDVKISIDSDFINFSKDFIGDGQHIASKNIDEINIKDFRDLFSPAKLIYENMRNEPVQ